MATIQYFDYIDFNEDVDENNGELNAPDILNESEQDDSTSNDQSHETSCDDWNFIETKIVSQSGMSTIKPGENFVLYGRVWNCDSELFLTRSDISAITASFYEKRMRTFAATEWVPMADLANASVPLTTVVDVSGEWRYDPDEWNFAWAPDQTDRLICEDEGVYAVVVKFELTNGRVPVMGEFEVRAMN